MNHSLKKLLALSAAALCGIGVASCGGGSSSASSQSSIPSSSSSASSESSAPSSSSESSASSASSESSEQQSQKAMENFAAKIAEGNYNVASPNLTTNVVSKDLVFFDYPASDRENHDIVNMSVNGETFQTRVDMESIKAVKFVDKGDAIDVAETSLPNYWFDEAKLGKDIWDIVHITSPSDPFHYVPKGEDMTLRNSIAKFAAVPDQFISTITNIAMDFDKEDVTKATLKAQYMPDPRTHEMIDVEIDINLGSATSNPLAEQWMGDPNRLMPAALGPEGEWDGMPLIVVNTILMLTTVREAGEWVPFIDFGSYAIWTNEATMLQDRYGIVHDYHATVQNVEDYKSALVRQQYTLHQEGGEAVYTKLMRAKGDKGCYVNIVVDYDDGFYLKVSRSYDVGHFNTRDQLNDLIVEQGFVAFPETEAVYSWLGEDDMFVQTENWSYFYDYLIYPVVKLKYNDQDAATAYLDAYGASLEEIGFVRGTGADATAWTLNTTAYELYFHYKFDQQGNLSFIMNREDFIDPAIMKAFAEGAGFPTVDITTATTINCRDTTKFEYLYNSIDCTQAYRNIFHFDDNDEAKKFLGQYKQALTAAGFEPAQGTPYLIKGNLIFQPNEAANGLVGLYFFEKAAD